MALLLGSGVHGAYHGTHTAPRPNLLRAPPPRAELGLQVDPTASAGSVFVLGGFAALQLKIRGAIQKREERDAAAEVFRKAEILLLAGKLKPEEVANSKQALRDAAEDYEEARRLFNVAGALIRIPDPTGAQADRLLRQQLGEEPVQEQAAPTQQQQPAEQQMQRSQQQQQPEPSSDALDPVREALGLRNPDAPAPPSSGSLLPTGSASVTLKDIAIGFVFILQLGWFCLSLTDPIGAPNPLLEAVLSSGGEYVDSMESRKAAENAEYKAMLQRAVDQGEAPPLCATRELNDPLGGCTTKLDADRGWIAGPPPSSSGGGSSS